jgi:hypothetical protein
MALVPGKRELRVCQGSHGLLGEKPPRRFRQQGRLLLVRQQATCRHHQKPAGPAAAFTHVMMGQGYNRNLF